MQNAIEWQCMPLKENNKISVLLPVNILSYIRMQNFQKWITHLFPWKKQFVAYHSSWGSTSRRGWLQSTALKWRLRCAGTVALHMRGWHYLACMETQRLSILSSEAEHPLFCDWAMSIPLLRARGSPSLWKKLPIFTISEHYALQGRGAPRLVVPECPTHVLSTEFHPPAVDSSQQVVHQRGDDIWR